MRAQIIIQLCLSISLNAIPQSDSLKIDSLKKALLKQKEDTNKVNTLNELSKAFSDNRNGDSAILYGEKSLEISIKTNYTKGQGYAHMAIGLGKFAQNNYNESMQELTKALAIMKQINDKQGIAFAFERSCYVCETNGDFSNALSNCFNALKIYQETGNKYNEGLILQLIGGAYYYQGDIKEAIHYNLLAIKIMEQIENRRGVAQSHFNNGEFYLILDRYTDALSEYSKAIENYSMIKDNLYGSNTIEYWNTYVTGRIGKTYEKQGDSASRAGDRQLAIQLYTKAKSKYDEFSKIVQLNIDKEDVILSYTNQGSINIKFKNFLLAKDYLDKSLSLSKEIGNKVDIMEAYKELTNYDSAVSDFKQLHENYKLYVTYRDSVNNIESAKKALQIRMEYEFDKREALAKAEQDKKDEAVKRTKNLQRFAIVAFLLAAVFLFIYSRQKQKAKNKIEKAYSKLKATQQQLIQSEKMASLGELTAGIAHEIQNPLNFVNNFSEVSKELAEEMKEELTTGNAEVANEIASDLVQNLEKINHHGQRAAAIVKGMLQHSRQSSGKKEPTDINALADEYLRLAYHGLRAKDKSFNAAFETNFDSTLPKLNVIPQDLGRVLLNIINNAFYAVNEKKKSAELSATSYEPLITVQTKKINDKVEVIVTDNGNGIPQNIIDKIFQPFFTTKPTGQGTGLGLSLAYDIVKAHGGEIKVATKEGEGTTFIIQLPAG